MNYIGKIILVLASMLIALMLWISYAYPHDMKRPDLNKWFESLHSGKGPCCSGSDGTVLSDVDWESRDGHYRVRIEGQWWDVPDGAVIKEPNLDGATMVWPVYYRNSQTGEYIKGTRIEIRCFIVGAQG